ncbi:MAG: phage GP46 family protein [Ahrensia sp.]|nr:phage GP46 family protein [Ahrensia sp.]
MRPRLARAYMSRMFFDAALRYNAQLRGCDCELADDGDLAIDETSITPVILSVGLDRRAHPDDELPVGRSEFLTQAGFSERRGGPSDALDLRGDLIGSRLWLLDRAKKTEITRLMVLAWLRECLQWAQLETGVPAEIEVEWLGRIGGSGSEAAILAYRVLVADAEFSRRQAA